jgi:hypothetical protein
MELWIGIEVLLLDERRLVGGEVGRNEWVGLAKWDGALVGAMKFKLSHCLYGPKIQLHF